MDDLRDVLDEASFESMDADEIEDFLEDHIDRARVVLPDVAPRRPLPVAVPVGLDVDEDGGIEELHQMAMDGQIEALDALPFENPRGVARAMPVAEAAADRDLAFGRHRIRRDREEEWRRRIDPRRHDLMARLNLRHRRQQVFLMRRAADARRGPVLNDFGRILGDAAAPGPPAAAVRHGVVANPPAEPAAAARNIIAAGPQAQPPRRAFRGFVGLFRRNNNGNARPQPVALDIADVADVDRDIDHIHMINDMEENRMEQMMMDEMDMDDDFDDPRGADVVRRSPDRYLFDLVREDLSCIMHTGNPRRNCSNIVSYCAESPAAINFVEDRAGRTPLHEAAIRCACIHTIRTLVATVGPTLPDRDSRICTLDSDFNTPLHLYLIGMAKRSVLSMDNVIPILTLLIGPNALNVPAKKNVTGNNALHLACSAPESMMPFSVVELLIAYMQIGPTVTNNALKTPLHLHCARRGASLDVARMLVEKTPEHQFLHDSTGQTPIHYAAIQGNGPLVEYLAECNQIYASERTTDNNRNVLHLFKKIDTKTLAVMLRKAPGCVAVRTSDTLMTPLHALLADVRREVSPQVVQMMITQDAGILRLEDKLGFLPIHHACQTGRDPRIIELLLTPATAAAVTHKEDTALSIAASQNACTETISLLIAAHAPALQMPNNYGFLPLHCVCRAHQPKEAIIRLLIEAYTEARQAKTHAGELPLHLAHHGASKAALHMLGVDANCISDLDALLSKSKVGNTPLHNACVHLANTDSIETMAEDHPDWLLAVNNAGYTPVQILCRNGLIDARLVRSIYNLVGITPFKSVDTSGHTPLHSAVRSGSDEAVRALIEVFPDALKMKTIYGDTPLHLACHRNVSFIGEIAKLTCEKATQHGSHISPLLLRNSSGETPISIAMSELKTQHGQCFTLGDVIDYSQLAVLIKILFYGTAGFEQGGIVVACLALHRQGARLDPSFIHRALVDHPEELRVPDSEGNYPLHLEASIPIEKMTLLDGENCSCDNVTCSSRASILKTMLDIFPEAAKYTNKHGDSVLSLIIKNGRPWDPTFAFIVRANPAALHSIESHELMPRVICRIGNGCGAETLYAFLRARPSMLVKKP